MCRRSALNVGDDEDLPSDGVLHRLMDRLQPVIRKSLWGRIPSFMPASGCFICPCRTADVRNACPASLIYSDTRHCIVIVCGNYKNFFIPCLMFC